MNENIETSIGLVKIKKAGIEDEEAILEIMRDAAKWLAEKGIKQWAGMLTENGQQIVQKRIKEEAAYIAAHEGKNIGTVALLWEDSSIWDDKGLDGLAGYIHGLAIPRRFEGKQIGKDILKWAIHIIKDRKPLVRLDCMRQNQRLCRYYEEIGFSIVGNKTFPNGWEANLYEKD